MRFKQYTKTNKQTNKQPTNRMDKLWLSKATLALQL